MKLKAKKLLTAALAAMMTLGAFTVDSQAATRAELASIDVGKRGKFQYWDKKSEAKAALVNYVKDVTNKNSKNFIPVEDRIAVFDVDGTLMCETAPFYFDWMMPLYRINNDPTYRATAAERNWAREVRAAIDSHTVTDAMDDVKAGLFPKLFQGMTPDEYRAYVKNYMNTNYVEGLSNLKVGEAFYMPMVEVVSYLNANKFTCYIVSGCEREAIRTLVNGIMNIEPNHIIGSDHSWTTAKLGNNSPHQFVYEPDDVLERGGSLRDVNVKTNKIYAIQREIGKKPVLAFSNSMGDSSMFNFTLQDNKYRSAAFVLMCDDLERELGNMKSANNIAKAAAKYGWTTVSMRDDWTTIYGDKVKREK